MRLNDDASEIVSEQSGPFSTKTGIRGGPVSLNYHLHAY